MDLILIIVGAGLFMAYLLDRLTRRPDQEFIKSYREILNSSKYRVKGHFEE